jgi:hypothetical protein
VIRRVRHALRQVQPAAEDDQVPPAVAARPVHDGRLLMVREAVRLDVALDALHAGNSEAWLPSRGK